MLLLALAACSPSTDPALLLTGWEYEWAELSHRIAYLRVGVEEDSSLSLGLVGGDWSTGDTFTDTPSYRVRYARVAGEGLTVARGTTTLAVGPDGVASGTVSVDGAALEGDVLTGVLAGFSIDTDTDQPDDYPADYDPAYGYTSRGFALSVGDASRAGEVVEVPVEATVRWAPQDREDMNAAIPYAVTAVTVDVAVVASSGAVDAVSVEAERPYTYQERPFTDQPPLEMAAVLEGDGEGVVAWRSFDLQLNLTGPDAGEGDYLRAFGAELVPGEVEPGRWAGTVSATMSTSSLSEWTDPTPGFAGELVRISAPDVVVEHFLVEGSHPTGLARTGPTLPE